MENVLATWQNLMAPHSLAKKAKRLECDSGRQDLRDPEERACMGSILASACSANSTVDWAFELWVDL